jgi:hypothetical protein
MRLVPCFLFAALAILVPGAKAQLIEHFDYADGPLVGVSGGAWQLWPGTTEDAEVINGKAFYSAGDLAYCDNVRGYNGVLTAPGQSATVAFDFESPWIAAGGETYFLWLAPWVNGEEVSTDGIYVAFFTDEQAGPNTPIRGIVREARGEGNTWTRLELGTFSRSETIHVSAELHRLQDISTYTIRINGIDLGSGTFVLDDPHGLNNVELFAGRLNHLSRPVNATFDNIEILSVPEPSSIVLLALGGAVLIRRKKRPRLGI